MYSTKPSLPYGWSCRVSRSYPGYVYYFNHITGHKTWKLEDLMMQVSQSQPYQVINSPCQVKHSLEADDKELLSLGLDELSDLLAVKKQNLEDLERRACRPSLSSLSPSLPDMGDPGSCFPGVGMSVLPTMETPQPRLGYSGLNSSEINRKKMMSMQVHGKKQIQELVIKNQFSGKPEGLANNAQTLEPVRKKKKKVSFVLTENDSGYLASNDTTEGIYESAVAVDRFSRAKSYAKEDAGEMREDGVDTGRRVGEEFGQEGSTVSLSTQQSPQPRLDSPQNSIVPSEQSLAQTQPSLVSYQPSGDMETKTWSRKTVFDMKTFVRLDKGGQFSCTLCDKSFKVRSNTNKHVMLSHLNVCWVCGSCGVKRKSKQAMLVHLRKVHGGTPSEDGFYIEYNGL